MGQSQSFRSVQEADFESFMRELDITRLLGPVDTDVNIQSVRSRSDALQKLFTETNLKGHTLLHHAIHEARGFTSSSVGKNVTNTNDLFDDDGFGCDWRFVAHLLAFSSIAYALDASGTMQNHSTSDCAQIPEQNDFGERSSCAPPLTNRKPQSSDVVSHYNQCMKRLVGSKVESSELVQETPFLLSSRLGRPMIMSLLLLYGASKYDTTEPSENLLRRGKTSPVDRIGLNALHLAASGRHTSVVRLLLGSLPLRFPVESDNEEGTGQHSGVFRSPPQPLNEANSFSPPVGIISEKVKTVRLSSLLKSLIRYNSVGHVIPDLLAGRSTLRETPLHLAVRECCMRPEVDADFPSTSRRLRQNPAEKRVLFDYFHTNLNENSDGKSSLLPLSRSLVLIDVDFSFCGVLGGRSDCEAECAAATSFLPSCWGSEDKEQASVIARMSSNRQCVLALLESGADINASNIDGNTALHLCCSVIANSLDNRLSGIFPQSRRDNRSWNPRDGWGSHITSLWGTSNSEAAVLLELCRRRRASYSAHQEKRTLLHQTSDAETFLSDVWVSCEFPVYFNHESLILKSLFDHGANVQQRNRFGMTPTEILDKCFTKIRLAQLSDSSPRHTIHLHFDATELDPAPNNYSSYEIFDPKSPYGIMSEILYILGQNY